MISTRSSRPIRIRSWILTLALAAAALFPAKNALGVFPYSDCQGWYGTGAWTGWAYVTANATLERQDGANYVYADQTSATELIPAGGAYLLTAPWTSPPSTDNYRVRVDLVIYSGGSGTSPPTAGELSTWPASQIFTDTQTGNPFGCGPGGPLFTSTPPSTATALALFTYDPSVSYSGSASSLVYTLPNAPAPEMTVDAATGHVAWTPAESLVGRRYAILRVTGAFGLFDIQALSIDVAPAQNHPPVAAADEYFANEDQTLAVVALEGVLANDDDPEATALVAALETAPQHGTIELQDDGSFTYTPDPDFSGLDSFTYIASDGALDSQPAEVSIAVTAANDPPQLLTFPDPTATEDQLYAVDVDATDIDGDPLTYELGEHPLGMTIDPLSGALAWTPRSSQTGANPLTVIARDPWGATATHSSTITVSGLNDAPLITSTPPLGASAGIAYTYAVRAIDPDFEDTVTFILETAPAGMAIDAATGLISWTPGPEAIGSHPVTVRATDAASAADTQSFTIAVASHLAPSAAFRPAIPQNVALYEDGATIQSVSNESSGLARYAISAVPAIGTGWITQSGHTTNEYFVVDLTGDLAHVIHGISITGAPTTNGARNIRVLVSPALDGEFTEVLAVELPRDDELHRYDFDPVHARRVKLLVLDNHGNATQLRVTHFDVHSRDGEGGVVSLFEGGASVVRATSETNPTGRPARSAIDFNASSQWFADVAPQTLTIELAGGSTHVVDRFRMYSPSDGPRAPKRFAVKVSTTTSDDAAFSEVLDATVPGDRQPHWFAIAPVPARYLQLVILETQGTASTQVLVEDFRAYSPARGGPNVAFDDFSSDPDGTIVRRRWDFGDGEFSTEEHPIHAYAEPGNYRVTLTVTDNSGLTATSSLDYFAAPPPKPDFSWTPSLPIEGTQGASGLNLTDLTPGTILDRDWSGPTADFTGGAATLTPFLSDSGDHAVTLTVTNAELITRSITQTIHVANVAPVPYAGADLALYWGDEWPMDATTADASPVDRTTELGCHWDFGDSTSQDVTDCGSNNRVRVTKTYAVPGTYFATLTATDKDGGSASDSAAITVLAHPTSVLVTEALSRTAAGEVTVRVDLVDRHQLILPVAGRSIVVSGAGASISALTDAEGSATVTLLLGSSAPELVSASFAGDLHYEASSGAATFTPSNYPVPPIIGAPSSAGSRGKEFVVAVGAAPVSVGLQFPYLHVGSVLHNVARVEVPAIGYDEAFEILPGVERQIQLPQSAWTGVSNGELIQHKGIRITSLRDITLIGDARTAGWTDSFLALPVDRLGTDYVVPTFASRPGGPAIIITAVEDDTTVHIVPKLQAGPLTGDPVDADPFDVVLDRLDSFYMRGAAYPSGLLADRSGAEITSDKPVAVLAGGSAKIPTGVDYEDYFVEMIPPIPAWRREFVTTPFPTRTSGYFIRIFAAENDTDLTIDGAVAGSIDRGEHLELEVTDRSSRFISATKPVIVVQLSKSCRTDGPTVCTGDPAMMIVPPIDQLAADLFAGAPQAYLVRDPAALGTPAPAVHEHYLTLFAPLTELGGLRFDGAPISATWTPIGATGFATAELPVSAGRHRVRHISPIVKFGMIEHSLGPQEESAHAGEQHLTPVAAGCAPATGTPGDLADDDCDGRTDEELANNLDDEGDGLIDEDLAYGQPDTNLPPRANSFALTVDEDSPATLVLTASDENGDPLQFDLVEAPAASAGTLLRYDPALLDPPPNGGAPPPLPVLSTMTNVGPAIRFVPAAGYSGTVYLRYLARDGEAASNTATATITVSPLNDAPRFTSTPAPSATQGQLYTYAAAATDQDAGDTRVFFLALGPAGLTMDGTSGVLEWTPANEHVGPNAVRIGVMDAAGAIDTQTFNITVANVNDPPLIAASDPPATGTPGVLYTANIAATDPDRGDQLRFSLDSAPDQMAIDALAGTITWMPLAPGGNYSVVARVTDTAGLFDTFAFSIAVTADTRAPRVSITASPRIASPGGTVTLTVTASDDVLVATTSLTVDGAPVLLDGDSRAIVPAGAEGTHRAIATAIDAGGNTATAETTYGVPVIGDATPPLAEMDAPVENEIITAPTDIIGTALDDHLLGYELSLAKGDTGTFTVIASGTGPIEGAVLGTLDPTLLENGLYRLQLAVTDANGATTETIIPVQIDGGMKVGAFTVSFVDLAIPVSGIPIAVTRTYDSRIKTAGDFGIGWKLDVAAGTYEHTRTPGYGWEFPPQRPPGGPAVYVPCLSLHRELSSHITEVRLSDRESYRFAIELRNPTRIGHGCLAEAHFTQIGGTTPGATLEIIGNNVVVHEFFTGELRDDLTLEIFDPREVRLSTHDGRTVDLHRARGITRLEDPNGNELYVDDSGLIHSSGKNITFTRDAAGRITAITDPLGRTLHYAYDAGGDLESFTDQAGNATTYTYDARHNLLDIVNALGVRATRSEYDDDGRLIAVIDSLGRRTEVDHNLPGRLDLRRDRLGHETIRYYDQRGNVTRMIDPLLNEWNYTFDERDNLLTETDPLGRVSSRSYDVHNNILSTTDFEGATTTYTRDLRGKVLTVLDSRGRLRVNQYDLLGNLTVRTDGEGAIVSYTHDSAGNILTRTDPLLNVTEFTYDGQGNCLSVTDALGNSTLMTYDALNRQVSTQRTRTLPGGAQETISTSMAYDELGRPTSITDPYGYSTTMTYDAVGRLSSVREKNGTLTEYRTNELGLLDRIEYVDGSFIQYSYDAEGRVTEKRDRGGFSTMFTYDELGRRRREIQPGGSDSETSYDAVGRVISSRDELGNVTTHSYPEPRREVIVDAMNRTRTILRNADGLPEEVTDALGRTIQYTYDHGSLPHGEGRLVRTDLPGGSFSTVSYDLAGRMAAATDAEGRSTLFGHDALGRLTSITDALQHTWTIAYDELGNRTSITDPKNHVRRFEYDRLGRMTRRELPSGQFETMTRDALGNVLSHTDFNGNLTTHVYDHFGRLITRATSGEPTETFTYGPRGERITAGAEIFEYDEHLNLISARNARGELVSYTYDAAGNRTAIIGPGGTTTFTFDALARLETVTDPDGGVATYDYDAAGRVSSVTLPNGVVTTHSYNQLDQLTRIESRDAADQLLAAYAYAPSLTGRLTGVMEEHTGRAVSWSFDEVYRLTEERITFAGQADRVTTYTYDEIGNRTAKLDSSSGLTAYVYDAGDRLLTETGPAGVTSYGYDAHGNLMSKSSSTASTFYEYNSKNQPIRVTSGAEVFDYEYNFDGSRTAKIVNGVRSNYLLDVNRPHAVVLRETDSSGVELASYVYGREELLSSIRPGQGRRYMLDDAQRSIRQVTGSAGEIIDDLVFDAFGVREGGTGGGEYGFAGERFDGELGTIYLRARGYDPTLGRFLSPDPLAGDPMRPASLNRYGYAENDPVNMRDPGGLSGQLIFIQMVEISTPFPNLLGMARGAWLTLSQQVTLAVATLKVEAALEVMAGPSLDVYHPYFDSGAADVSPGFRAAFRRFVKDAWIEMLRASLSHEFIYVDISREEACNSHEQLRLLAAVPAGDRAIIGFCGIFFEDLVADYTPAKILLHEMTHATDVAFDIESSHCRGGVCYGDDAAAALAEHSPDQAYRNADNYTWAASQLNSEL